MQLFKHFVLVMIVIPIWAQTQVAAVSNSTIQDTSQGIRWAEGLNWEQIKTKAKLENKYIFLDFYATWCAPCKKMDNEVYSDTKLGDYFKNKFISVKIQMDKTNNDNAFVRSWYNDAVMLGNQYRIFSYPSFVFLSPAGIIVHEEQGYHSVNDMIAIAQTAIQPNKKYENRYKEYDLLVNDYRQGVKNYERMPYMMKTAYKLGEKDFSKQLLNEHTDYIAGLPSSKRYTKEVIEIWSSMVLSSDGKRFSFFYNDGDLIDKVMNEKGYAQKTVDRTIQNEIIVPFYIEQTHGSGIMNTGMMMSKPNEKKTIDSSEADWKKLFTIIQKKYNKSYAKRNVLDAKLQWYKKHNNWDAYARNYLHKLEMVNNDPNLNNRAWEIFMNVKDEKILLKLIPWMKEMVREYPNEAAALDTYANLLYKVGRQKEAIEWEEKAINVEKYEYNKKEYAKIIEVMKKGQPTYGAVWK